MIILGLILLVIVAVFGIAVVVSNPGVHELSVFRVLVPVTYGGIFFTGVGATILAVLGLVLIRLGIRRARAVRAERRDLTALTSGSGSTRKAARADKESGTSKAAEPESTATPPTPTPSSSTSTPASTRSSLDLDTAGSTTTAAERRAMLDEADGITGDEELR